MQDPSQMTDAELFAIAGVQPQAPAAPRPAAPARPTSTSQPRGLRNNNPGNIEDGAFARSLPGYAGSDGRFARFETASAGAQAAPRLLRSYLDRGFNTPAKIINRWAPPSDNNPTDAYARYVAQRVGVGVNDPVSPDQIDLIAQAISEFENGQTVPSEAQPRQPGSPRAVVDMSDAELMALAEGQGQAVKAGSGKPPEWFIANGLPLNATTEDFLAAGWVPNPQTGEWEQGDPRSAGHVQALAQEREIGGPNANPGFTDQFTAPINDELAWLAGFGSQAVGNLGRALTGQEIEVSSLDRARAMRDVSREGQEAFEREHPLQAIGGGLLGGFAFAPARAAALPGLAGRLGQAGTVSGAYGVSEGDGVLGRAGSGLLSAGVGVGTAGVLEGGGAAAKGLLTGAERMRAPRGSLPNSSERRVGGALERALERDALTPQDLAGALPNLPEGKLPFEAGGENLIGLAETMAQAPGRARRDLLAAVGTRRDEATNRVAARLSDSFGAQGNGFQALRQSVKARGEEADIGMAQIADRPIPLTQSAASQADVALAPTGRGQGSFEIMSGGQRAGDFVLAPGGQPFVDRMEVLPAFRRQGVANAAHDQAEAQLGRRLVPSPLGLSDEATAFYKTRLASLPESEAMALLEESRQIGRSFGISDAHLDARLGPLEEAARGASRTNGGYSRIEAAIRSGLSSRAVRDAAEEAFAELTPESAAAANRLFGLSRATPDQQGTLPPITVREAQDISYALNEAAGRAYRGGFNSRGKALSTLSTTIRQHARDTVPEYDAWLKAFGDASETIDAMRTGQNVFAKANEKNAMSAAELAERWQGWSAPARDSYRLGVGEAVLDRARGQGGVTAMRKLLKDQELADRVRIAFDSEEAFLRFMQTADDEVSMANVNSQILGGSPTARRAQGAADLNQQGIGAGDVLDFATDITSPVGLGRQAVKVASRALPRRDRSILGNEELNGLLGRALTDETEMTRLLNLIQSDRGLRDSVSRRLSGFGLLSRPGTVAGGQERARGLLTANP